MRIIVLDGQTLDPGDNPWTGLFQLGDVVIHPRSSPEEVAPRCDGAGVVVVNKVRLTREQLDQLPELKFIAVSATGHDCVDSAFAASRGIPVSNVPVYGTDSVAQFTISLLLELCHRVGLHDSLVHEGEWSRASDFCFWRTPQVELAGLTLGVVGFGRIGRRVGELGRALGMRVIAAGRLHQAPPQSGAPSAASPRVEPFEFMPLDQLFETADVVSLHCPLNAETAGLVHRERLARMKPTAMLLNTSRGGLVVEADLAEALNAGRIAAAAVDVVSAEPIRPDNPLLGARNCVITPHIAWASVAARRRLLSETVGNVAAFLAGRPRNVVNGVVAGA